MNTKKDRFVYLGEWVKIALICIVFFALMFLQVSQAKKVNNIKGNINNTKEKIISISLEIAEVNLQIEKIKNSGIIDNYARNVLGMKKINNKNYKLIENGNE